MRSFRPLVPKQISPESSASASASGTNDQPEVALAKATKRKLTATACVYCRQKKTKCDGERPSCRRCLGKKIECTYPDDGDAHIRTSKLLSYDCLLNTLRGGSTTDAEATLHRLRQPVESTEDSANRDRLKAIQDFIKRLQEAPEEEAADLLARIRSGELQDDVFRDARLANQSEEPHHRAHEEADDVLSPMVVDSEPGKAQALDYLVPGPAISPEEPDHLEDILYCWNRMSVSDTSRIGAAVDAFFELSEKWFLVFSKETIMRYHRDIYVDSPDRSQPLKQAELCCLCAVAAVGMRYGYQDEHALGYSETLYHTSTNYFSLLAKILPLDAIKVCTLLANFNIKNKRTTALAFVEIGLSLCIKHDLNDGNLREPGMTEDTWLNHRKTWRTLLFQSLFLSSTLGYVFGGGLFFEEFPVSAVELETLPMLQITVSRELTKLCLLKANISRMDFALTGQAAASPVSMMQDLQDWYKQLPSDLYLASLIDEQVKEKRVAIYYVNLMFLSVTGLLYRRTAGRFLRSAGLMRSGAAALQHPDPSHYVFDNAKEGILAAQQSARIFELLVLEDVGIWKCWLVIFQAYTTCTVVLHSALQKQLHGDSVESWTADLHHAQSCLAILERCGQADATVNHMHGQLAGVFGRVASFEQPLVPPLAPGGAAAAAGDNAPALLPPDYLLTIPDGSAHMTEEHIQLSTTLLARLCGPFENVGAYGMQVAFGSPA